MNVEVLKLYSVPRARPFPLPPFMEQGSGGCNISSLLCRRALDDWGMKGRGTNSSTPWNVGEAPTAPLAWSLPYSGRVGLALPCPYWVDAAMLKEQDGVRLQTEEELLEYCHGVAGTIGLIRLPSLALPIPVLFQHADNLGIAMQLTNICRMIRGCSKWSHLLPHSFFSQAPKPQDLLSTVLLDGGNLPGERKLWAWQTGFIKVGKLGCHTLPLRSYRVRWAARMYREIGQVIRSNSSPLTQASSGIFGNQGRTLHSLSFSIVLFLIQYELPRFSWLFLTSPIFLVYIFVRRSHCLSLSKFGNIDNGWDALVYTTPWDNYLIMRGVW